MTVVQLPLQSSQTGGRVPPTDFRDLWRGYGVEWVERSDSAGPAFLARARLPAGWSAQEHFEAQLNRRNFMILDPTKTPRISVVIERTLFDQSPVGIPWANVLELSPTQAETLRAYEQNKTDAERRFDVLFAHYCHVWQTHAGCGPRADPDIAQARAPLEAFVATRREFAERLPLQCSMYDDGTQGHATGLQILAGQFPE